MFTYVGISPRGRSDLGLSAAVGPGDPVERGSLNPWELYSHPR